MNFPFINNWQMRHSVQLGVKGLLLDVQGTLVKRGEGGRNVLIGGKRLLQVARSKGIAIRVLTNASRSNSAVLRELVELGLELREGEVISAAELTAAYLRERMGSARVWVLGEPELVEVLKSYGHEVIEERPDAVVVGLDRTLTYDKLNRALQLLRQGALLVGCHASRRIPGSGGETLSVGPIVKALEYASETKAIVIGKPSKIMFRAALRDMGLKAMEVAMVSDELRSDLGPAKSLGMKAVLTLTGVSSREDVHRLGIVPDLIVENVDDLADHL